MTGADLRALRQRLGLSQTGLAEALDLSRSTIGTYEAGRNRGTGKPMPIPRVVELACIALEFSWEEVNRCFA